MSDHVYKMLELTGSSSTGIEDAVNNAISRASETVRNLSWVEVKDIRGAIENGRVRHWQVSMKIGFTLET
ncbi:MAG: dodecin [Caulobacterales bacterium]